MDDHKIDFRWGIPELDSGFTVVPNYLFRHYSSIGVTHVEFTFILHLASYKHNSPRGLSCPSLTTIAVEMGISTRQAQRIRGSLEENGYLEVTARPGKTNVYSVQAFALACLELSKRGDTSVTPDIDVTPPPTPVSPLPPTPVSPKEQEQQEKEQQQQDVVVVSSQSVQEKTEALEYLGIPKEMAADLVKKHGTEQVGKVLDHMRQSLNAIKNPGGWVIAALREDYDFPELASTVAAKQRLRHLRATCVFLRNPGMGECPAEECGEAVYPWCRGCERACPVAP